MICPICQAMSFHPVDIAEGYCGNCHAFTTDRAVDLCEREPVATIRAVTDDGRTSAKRRWILTGPRVLYLLPDTPGHHDNWWIVAGWQVAAGDSRHPSVIIQDMFDVFFDRPDDAIIDLFRRGITQYRSGRRRL